MAKMVSRKAAALMASMAAGINGKRRKGVKKAANGNGGESIGENIIVAVTQRIKSSAIGGVAAKKNGIGSMAQYGVISPWRKAWRIMTGVWRRRNRIALAALAGAGSEKQLAASRRNIGDENIAMKIVAAIGWRKGICEDMQIRRKRPSGISSVAVKRASALRRAAAKTPGVASGDA
jgi:hypothetical protein